jgi:hypothetical protein
MKQRRSFPESFAEALRVSASERRWRAFVPYVLIVCGIIGSIAASYVPDSFWIDSNWGISATVFVGFVTFNALLLAFSQNALLKIQDTVSNGRIGALLARQGLLDETLFAVELNQLTLAVSAAASAISLVGVILPLDLIVDKILGAVTFSLSLYALMKAYAATREMNDFIWERIHLELEGVSETNAVRFPPQQGNGGRLG